jgi:hypothetical protein
MRCMSGLASSLLPLHAGTVRLARQARMHDAATETCAAACTGGSCSCWPPAILRAPSHLPLLQIVLAVLVRRATWVLSDPAEGWDDFPIPVPKKGMAMRVAAAQA